MQKTNINGQEIELPECHDGDKEWLASVLYGIESRKHEAKNKVNELQRNAMIKTYEKTYLKLIANHPNHKGPSIARRAANIELRAKIDSYHDMRTGNTIER